MRKKIKTQIALGMSKIAKENAFSSSRVKFVAGIWPKVWVASTTKYLELRKIRSMIIQFLTMEIGTTIQ